MDRFGGDALWLGAGFLGILIWLLTAVLARKLREPAGDERGAGRE